MIVQCVQSRGFLNKQFLGLHIGYSVGLTNPAYFITATKTLSYGNMSMMDHFGELHMKQTCYVVYILHKDIKSGSLQ